MQRFVLGLMLLLTKPVCAQIYFQNPSFEDDSLIAPCEFCSVSNWQPCNTGGGENFVVNAAYVDSQMSYWVNSSHATDGEFFTGITAFDPLLFGDSQISLSQQLDCSLKPEKQYCFTIDYLSRVTNFGTGLEYEGQSFFQVIVSNDSCTNGEMVFELFDLDTSWHTILVSFMLTDERNILWLKQKPQSGSTYGAAIDNLSPITCLNYNEVQSTTNDTSISIGNCITLNATPLGAYDSAYWKTSSGTIVGTGLVGVQVCPTGFTEYVACTRSTDCGQFWSYDTVRVEVPNGVPSTKPFIASITPTTNCSHNNFYVSTNQNCTLEVYDLSGRVMYTAGLHQGKQTFKLNELSNGVYICKLQSHQAVQTQRIVITNCN
jgi:hypothetical protein